jgi:hypothetical protein
MGNANTLKVNLQNSSANIIYGTWNGTLNVGETKEVIFKARYDEAGDYIIIFNVDTGQSSEGFQEKVTVKSKVTSVLKEGPMKSLIFITREYILTQDRIRLAQNSINIFFYIGILLSTGIILNSARQTLPNMEKSKKKVVKRKDKSIKSRNNAAIYQERLRLSKERKDKGIKRESIRKRE